MARSVLILSTLLVFALFACSPSVSQTSDDVQQPSETATPQPTSTEPPTEEASSTPEESPTVATPTSTPTSTATPQKTGTPISITTGMIVDIGVIGSDRFVSQTERALELLASCAPDAIQTADELINVVQESERSGMLVGEGVFLASEVTAFAPGYSDAAQLFWYGGAMVHDAHHRGQSQQGRTLNWDEMTLEERETLEMEARQVQLDALEMCTDELPATTQREWSFMLQYLIDMQTGVTDCDYCKVEWDNRNW